MVNILSTMFYNRTNKFKALANMTVSDSVSPSPKGERSQLGPVKSATGFYIIVFLIIVAFIVR